MDVFEAIEAVENIFRMLHGSINPRSQILREIPNLRTKIITYREHGMDFQLGNIPDHLNKYQISEYSKEVDPDTHLQLDVWLDLNLLSLVYSVPDVEAIDKHDYAMLHKPVMALIGPNINQELSNNPYLEVVKETLKYIVNGKPESKEAHLWFSSCFCEDIRRPEYVIDLYGNHEFDNHLREDIDCHDIAEVFRTFDDVLEANCLPRLYPGEHYAA
jgi:hypothetical protein